MSRAVAAVVLVLVTAVGLPTVAHADARIGLSTDRRTWTDHLGAGLFDPDLRWVPGDRRTETFYVRNQSDDPADLVVSIRGSRMDSLLRAGLLMVTARGGDGESTPVDSSGDHRLFRVARLQPSAVQRVNVTVRFAAGATNPFQSKALDLALNVRLDQQVDDDGAGSDSLLLPDTGGVRLALVIVAAALIALGFLILRRRPHPTDNRNDHDD